MSFAQNQPIAYADMVAELNNKADKSPSPRVSRAVGRLDEMGDENIMGVLTYHKITKTASILAGDIIFGDCHTLTNRFYLPLNVLRWLVNDLSTPSETCFGSWSIEGLTADKVATLTGKGRVLRLSSTAMSFERLYEADVELGQAKTGAWPFSQFSNSHIHFQVVVV